MAKTIASGVGITNAWVAEQGVLNLKTLRAKLAHFLETAWYGPACRSGVGRVVRNGSRTRFLDPGMFSECI
jgi:hypothetical protein